LVWICVLETGFIWVSYGFGVWLFCGGYFPIQKLTLIDYQYFSEIRYK